MNACFMIVLKSFLAAQNSYGKSIIS